MDPQKPSDAQEPVTPNPVNPAAQPTPFTEQTPVPPSSTPPQGAMPPAEIPATHQPTMFTPSPPKPKKKNWLKAVVIGAAGVLLLGGASAAAYFGYYVPNQPDNILKKALSNTFTSDAKTAYLDGEFSVKSNEDELTINGTLEGKADDEGNLDFNVKVDALITTITFDVRSIDGDFYFKVSGLEGLPELLGVADDPTVQTYASLIETVDDQWIEINKSLIEQFTGVEGGTELSKADLEKLANIFRQHPFLKVKQTLPDEAVKGAQSYHYQVVADKTELQAAFQELKSANIKGLKVTQEEVDALKDSLKNVDLAKYPVDVWIDKQSKIINQLGLKLKDSQMTSDLRITFFDFNKPVSVEKPEGAMSVLEVLGPILGGFMQGGFEDPMFDPSIMDPALMQQLEAGGISL